MIYPIISIIVDQTHGSRVVLFALANLNNLSNNNLNNNNLNNSSWSNSNLNSNSLSSNNMNSSSSSNSNLIKSKNLCCFKNQNLCPIIAQKLKNFWTRYFSLRYLNMNIYFKMFNNSQPQQLQ